MISSLVIVFREMLEMVLVVGILLAATRGLAGTRVWIAIGAAGGLIGALFFGIFMEQMEAAFEGDGEFIFNASILMLASILIAWTVFWMNRHGREMSLRMKQVGASVQAGDLPYTALAVVALSAVMREGSEAVFFLFGAAQSVQADGWSMLFGGLMGAGAALVIGALLYFGLARIPVSQLFSVAGWLLMLLAAGMASQAAWNLVVIDYLPAVIDPLWNTSSILPAESLLGELLHVLMGYDDQPTGLQVIVFVVSLTTMVTIYYHLQSKSTQSERGVKV
jgi:high-affinity iron transporter